MIAIRIVVCPIDFSAATERQVSLAVGVCRAFGAQLVLHHNVVDVSAGAAVGWMWHADHEERPGAVEAQLRAVAERVPKDVPVHASLTRGAATEAALQISDAVEADLIVLSAHDGKTEDHASVIEYLLNHSHRPVLALHDVDGHAMAGAFDTDAAGDPRAIVVPVNSLAPHPQVDVACELARRFPLLELHLLHALAPLSDPALLGPAIETRRAGLAALVPDDLADRTDIHVDEGDPVSTIVNTARELAAAMIIMGEHTRVPVKRWFSHDTARAVLHEAHCPVWYVPTAPLAPPSFSDFALSREKSIIWGNV
jgi:nucleotide-binding universal stress UspA family protein